MEKKGFYDKSHKIFLVLTLIFLFVCIFYLYNFNKEHGDIIEKDISLTGGTSVQVSAPVDIPDLNQKLSEKFNDYSVRVISNILTGEQIAFVVETSEEPEVILSFLEDYLGFELTSENSSVEFTGSSLSASFYNQLRFAILLSFIFMALVVFIIFRSFIPSSAVIFSAFSDVTMTLAVVNLLGMRMSTAGIVAFLMLIGYSVDTDILLTTRLLKQKGSSVNQRILGAFKTGITMTLTSLVVVLIGFFLTRSISPIFNQIFTILTIGLIFDILNTWMFNASLLKWYVEKKEND
jgi:preprotein translocase subunit SecF